MPATGDRITKRKDGRFRGYTSHTPDGPKRKYIYGRKHKDVERQWPKRWATPCEVSSSTREIRPSVGIWSAGLTVR